MAEEQDSGQERTEDPTPKRLQDAKRKGQVPRSKELTMTMVMLVGAGAMFATGGYFAGHVESIFGGAFSIDRQRMFDDSYLLTKLAAIMSEMLLVLAPLLLALLVTALLAPTLLGGWSFSLE